MKGKRIISLLAAIMLLFGMNITGFAAESHSIVLTGAKSGHVYHAYQIFSGRLSQDEKTLSDTVWGSGVNGDTLLAQLKKEADFSGCSDAESVAKVLSSYGDDSEALSRFASTAVNYLTDAAFVSAYNEESGVYTINGLTDGYYLVKDMNPAADNDAVTKYILRVVKDVEMEVKSDIPTLDKYMLNGEETVKSATAAIGDRISYQLVSFVPEMDGYTAYEFNVHDTFSAGLTFNDDVVVKIGEKTLKESLGEFNVITNGQTIEIELYNMTSYKAQAGSEIVITYSAVINENAAIGSGGNSNSAYLEYSNDPNSTSVGKTPSSYTITYLTGIDLKKVDDNETPNPLTGAKFRIEGTKLNKVKVVRGEEVIFTETSEKVKAEAEVHSDGTLSFHGLSEGTYTITELVAPDGYNLLKDPIQVEVTCNLPTAVEEGDEEAVWNFKVSGAVEAEVTGAEGGVLPLQVVNKPGVVLPVTGGMGTTILYVSGILMLAASVFVIWKKVRSAK